MAPAGGWLFWDTFNPNVPEILKGSEPHLAYLNRLGAIPKFLATAEGLLKESRRWPLKDTSTEKIVCFARKLCKDRKCVEKDEAEATRWFARAAKDGFAKSEARLHKFRA